MIMQTLSEYAPEYKSYTRHTSTEFQLALDLIREHRALDLRRRAVVRVKLSLEVLIQALLAFSRERGFIKYDPWDPTIQIKHFKHHVVAYQYNPYREPANRHADGQKPAANQAQRMDFLAWETFPENEHFLVWTASSGRRYGILVQPAPIIPDHLIVASLDFDSRTRQHYGQVMHYFQMSDMHELQLQLFALGYAMGYNDRGAGASVDHFHTQAVPRIFLPLVRAYQNNRLHFADNYVDDKGVHLKILQCRTQAGPLSPAYPAHAFLLEADRSQPLLTKKKAVLKQLHAHQAIFNSLAWQQPNGRYVEFFFPRGQESIMNNAFNAGYVEMSGMLVVPKKELFESIKKPSQGAQALQAAGLSTPAFQNILRAIYHYFS
ncbi:DUF4922 domain-containing protein [candidate division FCPU426 bacterium]|nr:DUF4922 domain-containing protein [candidate division FCPU426 bacterium]